MKIFSKHSKSHIEELENINFPLLSFAIFSISINLSFFNGTL